MSTICGGHAFFGSCGYGSACQRSHIKLPPVTHTGQNWPEQQTEKVYYAVDPSNAKVLDDAFALEIKHAEEGGTSTATLEICLVNPDCSFGEDVGWLMQRAAARGCDAKLQQPNKHGKKKKINMLGTREPTQQEIVRNGSNNRTNVAEDCSFKYDVPRSAIRLTLPCRAHKDNCFVLDDASLHIERAFDITPIVVCRRTYFEAEDDPVSKNILDMCFSIVQNDFTSSGGEGVSFAADRCLNGLRTTNECTRESLVTVHPSTKFFKGSVVVSGLKRIFDRYALQYLISKHALPSQLISKRSLSPCPLGPLAVDRSELAAWTLGLVKVGYRCGAKAIRCECVNTDSYVPDGGLNVLFSPALRVFPACYNSVVLARVIEGTYKRDEMALTADDLLAASKGMTVADRADAETMQVAWKSFALEAQNSQRKILTVKRQRDGHPEFMTNIDGRFDDVALQLRPKARSSTLDVRLRFVSIDAEVVMHLDANTLLLSSSDIKRTFNLSVQPLTKAGVSQLEIYLDKGTATWYAKQMDHATLRGDIVQDAANLIVAVCFKRSNHNGRRGVLGNVGDRCKGKEVCTNARCCRVHPAEQILTAYQKVAVPISRATFAAKSTQTRCTNSTAHIDFRNSILRAHSQTKQGDLLTALQTLSDSLLFARCRWKRILWSDIKNVIRELFHVLCTLRPEPRSLLSMWEALGTVRERLHGNFYAGRIWEHVLKELRLQLESLLNDTKTRFDEALNATAAAEQQLVVAITAGSSVKKILARRFSVDAFVANVVQSVISSRFMGTSSSMQRLVSKTVIVFCKMVEKHHLQANTPCIRVLGTAYTHYLYELLFETIAEPVDPQCEEELLENERTRQLKEHRRQFHRNPLTMEKMFKALNRILSANTTQVDHTISWDVVQTIMRILREFVPEDTDKLKMLSSTYRSLSDVFAQCGNGTFHALMLIWAAKAEKKAIEVEAPSANCDALYLLATKTVLACLAIPEPTELRSLFDVSDLEYRHGIQIAECFGLTCAPNRKHLCEEVLHSRIVDDAHPDAGKLLTVLIRGTCSLTLCQEVESLLDEIKSNGFAADVGQYGDLIRRFSLIQHLSKNTSESLLVELQVLHTEVYGTKRNFDVDYARMLEPLLLNDMGCPLVVDQSARKVVFSSARHRRVNDAFTHVAQVATPAVKATAVRRQPLPITLSDIDTDVAGCLLFHDLVLRREDEEAKRDQKMIELRKKEAEDIKQKKIDEENKKQSALLAANEAKRNLAFAEAERKERQLLLIQELQEKFKVKVPADLVTPNHDSFIDALTAIVATHQRAQEITDVSDMRELHHIELEIREQDIPRRIAVAEAHAAQLGDEQRMRWENVLAQHRAEYDAKVAARERLMKFVRHAERFEAEIASRVPKATKRDEQEECLRAEKARLAAAAACSAAAAAAAAPEASSAASAPDASTVQPTAGRQWVPKNRQ